MNKLKEAAILIAVAGVLSLSVAPIAQAATPGDGFCVKASSDQGKQAGAAGGTGCEAAVADQDTYSLSDSFRVAIYGPQSIVGKTLSVKIVDIRKSYDDAIYETSGVVDQNGELSIPFNFNYESTTLDHTNYGVYATLEGYDTRFEAVFATDGHTSEDGLTHNGGNLFLTQQNLAAEYNNDYILRWDR